MAQKQRCMYNTMFQLWAHGVHGRSWAERMKQPKDISISRPGNAGQGQQGSRRLPLQTRRESVGVSVPEAVSTILGLKANASPRTSVHAQTIHSEGSEVSTYGIDALGRMVTFFQMR